MQVANVLCLFALYCPLEENQGLVLSFNRSILEEIRAQIINPFGELDYDLHHAGFKLNSGSILLI